MTIGEHATKAGIQQKLRRLAYGLSGEIPDGMLVRVSTIQANDAQAWRVQDRFVTDMLGNMAPRDRSRLLGAGLAPAADGENGAPAQAASRHAAQAPARG